ARVEGPGRCRRFTLGAARRKSRCGGSAEYRTGPIRPDRKVGAVTSDPVQSNAFATYVGRIRELEPHDWWIYVGWVGLMLGLVLSTGGFLLVGANAGVTYPAEAWLVPIGALVFSLSIAIDTIGHRTVYREEIKEAESLVHGITIFCG